LTGDYEDEQMSNWRLMPAVRRQCTKAALLLLSAFLFLHDPTAHGQTPADSGSTDDIFVCKLDGSENVRITNDDRFESRPSWSPDSKRIAYSSMTPDRMSSEIRVYDFASATSNSYLPGADKYDPCFSPDGKLLAYAEETEWRLRICISALDGSEKRWIDKDDDRPSYDSNPVWSPDSKSIAFSSREIEGHSCIRIADVSHCISHPLELPAESEDMEYFFPCWDIRNNKLLVSKSSNKSYFILCKADPLTSKCEDLACGESLSYGTASLSPDGRYVTYVDNDKDVIKRLIPPDREPEREEAITPRSFPPKSLRGAQFPVVSQDGVWLAYVGGKWNMSKQSSSARIAKLARTGIAEAGKKVGWALWGARGEILLEPRGLIPHNCLLFFECKDGLEARRFRAGEPSELLFHIDNSGAIQYRQGTTSADLNAFRPETWPYKKRDGTVCLPPRNTIVSLHPPSNNADAGVNSTDVWLIMLADGNLFWPAEGTLEPSNTIHMERTSKGLELTLSGPDWQGLLARVGKDRQIEIVSWPFGPTLEKPTNVYWPFTDKDGNMVVPLRAFPFGFLPTAERALQVDGDTASFR